jgi:DNA-binding CsgD family transcriptional regulator
MVRFDELRHALRLAGELRELPRGSELQKRHALDGLCSLVGAQVGLWCVTEGMDSGRVMLLSAIDRGFSGESERESFLRFLHSDQQCALDPSMAPLATKAAGAFFTVTREQLVDDRTWYRSEHVQDFRRVARVDSCIYTAARSSSTGATCLSIHRPWGARPFSERERLLVDAFHQECRWLHAPSRTVDGALLRGLGPRLRETLQALARGLSEKQIAAELGLSRHTVHEYAKALHRHFGVSSRSELLALCLGTSDGSRHFTG